MYSGHYQLACDCGRKYQIDIAELPPYQKEAAPSASTNTASQKLPSSTEVWKHVVDNSSSFVDLAGIESYRKVAQLVYEFIRRQHLA